MTNTSTVDGIAVLDSLRSRAKGLVPALRARRRETDALRRLPDETVADIRGLGIAEMAVPRELGGPDLGADGILNIAMELAQGCPATAWCAGNWAVHNLLIASMSAEAQDEVFADGLSPLVSTGFSPARANAEAIAGGSRLSGQWDFVSGVDHADWIVVVGVGPAGGIGHLIPRSDVTIVDTWHTTGLKGTGSQDVRVDNLFVPSHRLINMAELATGRPPGRDMYESPFLRLPIYNYFGCAVIGTIVGAALGAVEVFTEITSQRSGGVSGIQGKTRPELQLRLGEAAAEIEAAALVVRRTFEQMRSEAAKGDDLTPEQLARWRRDIGWTAKTAAAGVGRLYEAAGAHSLYEGDQLQQFARDVGAGAHHFAVGWDALFRGWAELALDLS